MKKYLAVYEATSRRGVGGSEVTRGSVDVSASVLDMAAIRSWEEKIKVAFGKDSVVITNVIPLDR